ncbi:hypothetical protein PM082_005413 [Marasmius tenuissimus]|nr:hypothetical protein PM082_005413 [Marasmius tenuissimus]
MSSTFCVLPSPDFVPIYLGAIANMLYFILPPASSYWKSAVAGGISFVFPGSTLTNDVDLDHESPRSLLLPALRNSVCSMISEYTMQRRVGDPPSWVLTLDNESPEDNSIFCNTWNHLMGTPEYFAISFETGVIPHCGIICASAEQSWSITQTSVGPSTETVGLAGAINAVESVLRRIKSQSDLQFRALRVIRFLRYLRKALVPYLGVNSKISGVTIFGLRRRLSPLYVGLRYPPSLSICVSLGLSGNVIIEAQLFFPSIIYRRKDSLFFADITPNVMGIGYNILSHFGYPADQARCLKFPNDKSLIRAFGEAIRGEIRHLVKEAWNAYSARDDVVEHQLSLVSSQVVNLCSILAFSVDDIKITLSATGRSHVSVFFGFPCVLFVGTPVRFLHNHRVGCFLVREGLGTFIYADGMPWMA